MYGKMKHKMGHTTNSRHHEDMPHHMAPKSRTLMPQGKAIPSGTTHSKMNWTESVGGQKAGLVRAGAARKRRTMMNRGQGTGLAGKTGRHITIPKVTRSGHYPLMNESRGY